MWRDTEPLRTALDRLKCTSLQRDCSAAECTGDPSAARAGRSRGGAVTTERAQARTSARCRARPSPSPQSRDESRFALLLFAEAVAQRVSETSTPTDAQIATGAAAQAACRTSAGPTRPTLPGLLTRMEMGSYWPGLGLCDSLRAKREPESR
jgi:hypothetical protein